MNDYLTITDAARALRAGEVSAEELVEASIAAADEQDEALGVYISRFDESARARARAVDDSIRRGEPLGALAGIPVGLKDIIAESEGVTTAQSRVLSPEWGERTGEGPVVRRLKDAGAIVTGKTTTMEFALGMPDPAQPFPSPRSAWDSERWAGGSSSGSGAGVAAGMFLGAIGTDTTGSIRTPAAFNGVTGFKPSYGRVPKAGIFPLSWSLDHAGPIARSAEDCALMLSVIAGHDASDPFASVDPVDDYLAGLTGDLTGLRIGVDDLEYAADGGVDPLLSDRMAAALGVLTDAGAEVVPLRLPMYAELSAAAMVTMLTDVFAIHERDLRERWDLYGLPTRISFAGGARITGADFQRAQQVRRLGRARIAEVFGEVDVVLSPTNQLSAPKLAGWDPHDPLALARSMQTFYWSALGNPTVATPIGLSSEGMPLSVTVAAARGADTLALRVADAFQRRTAHHLARAPKQLAAPAGVGR